MVLNNGWMPIETAPKDIPDILPDYGIVRGRDILISDGHKIYIGHWEERYQSGYHRRRWFPLSAATHWMPLPEMPQC